VLLEDDAHGLVVVGYETPGAAPGDVAAWPDEFHAALAAYHPATEVLFLVEAEGDGTLIGLQATSPCVTPWEAGQGALHASYRARERSGKRMLMRLASSIRLFIFLPRVIHQLPTVVDRFCSSRAAVES
jgi:hypothetical protein